MSSVQSLRDFISQRLSAAAAEIFTEFEKTIEEEMDRQRGLLDNSGKPQINASATERPQQHVCEEQEMLADLHLCYEERNSGQDQNQPEPPQIEREQEELFSTNEEEQLVLNQGTETSVLLQNTSRCEETLEVTPQDLNQLQEALIKRVMKINWNPEIRLHRIDLQQQHVCKKEDVLSDSVDQEEPELPQIKEEQEELCSSQEGEQLVPKQETETFMMTTTDQERDLSEAEPNTEQLHAHDSPLTERTNQEQSQNLDLGSTTDIELNAKKKRHRKRTDDKSVDHSHVLQAQLDTESGEKVFKCDVCGKTFSKRSNMLCHYKIHTGEKPFKCKTCGKAFTQKGNLLKHTRIHTGEKPFKCKTCGKAFTRKGVLLKHTRIHTGERPFKCKTCGKDFTWKCNLLQHTRIHTGEKPYKCKTCEKAFTLKGNLLQHTRIHTGEKPFNCKTCGKSFTQHISLLIHMRMHTGEKPYKCKSCGKAFTLKHSFLQHTRIHKGQKPFKCKKAFTQKGNFPEHTQIHTDERLFKCKKCGKAFIRKCLFLKHSKIHSRRHILVENISQT